MAGNASCCWAVNNQVVQHSKAWAKKLSCPNVNREEMVQGLLTKPAKKFERGIFHDTFGPVRFGIQFAPRIDGEFLPKSVAELRKEAPKKKCLIGTTDVEALFFGKVLKYSA